MKPDDAFLDTSTGELTDIDRNPIVSTLFFNQNQIENMQNTFSRNPSRKADRRT